VIGKVSDKKRNLIRYIEEFWSQQMATSPEPRLSMKFFFC
jgi:hypothetical protein